MRKILRKLVHILDGTPAVYGKRQSGQSVVELALVTPILIILFAGLVEIGWFANNYLNLLDVTRVGARRGATLQNELSPLSWDNDSSWMPTEQLSAQFQAERIGYMAYDPLEPLEDQQRARVRYRYSQNNPNPALRGSGCGGDRGFYNEVICTMITSMEPLVLNPENGVDDIIVSGFAIERIDPSRNRNPLSTPPWLGPNRPYPGQDIPQMVVVGRYPTNANECDWYINPETGGVGPLEPRDPFDFNENGFRDMQQLSIPPDPLEILNDDFTELPGYDVRRTTLEEAEKQVGFVWLGQHRIPNTRCIGSEFTIAEIERLMNLESYVSLSVRDERERLPGQGLILVEMHWQHELLLQMPVFNPVFTVLGGTPTISVWAAFPLPAVEPYFVLP